MLAVPASAIDTAITAETARKKPRASRLKFLEQLRAQAVEVEPAGTAKPAPARNLQPAARIFDGSRVERVFGPLGERLVDRLVGGPPR